MTGDQPESFPSMGSDAPTDPEVRSALTNLARLIAAIVADDHLSTAEVEFLAQWLDASKSISRVFPAGIISRRIRAVMDDGVITTEEKEQLLAELKMYLEPRAGT